MNLEEIKAMRVAISPTPWSIHNTREPNDEYTSYIISPPIQPIFLPMEDCKDEDVEFITAAPEMIDYLITQFELSREMDIKSDEASIASLKLATDVAAVYDEAMEIVRKGSAKEIVDLLKRHDKEREERRKMIAWIRGEE